MKLSSWNVNGIRASWEKGLEDYIQKNKFDVLCLQEVKAQEHQLSDAQKHPLKMLSFLFSAKKPGYSSVMTFSKTEPESVIQGIGRPEFDDEGRVLTLEFRDFFVVNSYFPNSQRDHARLPYKLAFTSEIFRFLEGLRAKGKGVIICGDFNIAHKEIDLKNPKSNIDNAGFLPEERAWMDEFLSQGWVDAFRLFEPGGGHYTWWSYRPGVREKNIGWRLDYHCLNQEIQDRVKKSTIRPDIRGSDHCPIELLVAH